LGILDDLLATIRDDEIEEVVVGLHWTAVVANAGGKGSCGMTATLRRAPGQHVIPNIPDAGELDKLSGLELANLVFSPHPTMVSIGMAAINALLPRQPERWYQQKAQNVIARLANGRRVVLIGHFPFVPRLRSQVDNLIVLELEPNEGDLPASEAPNVIPEADVVAITSMTLINNTLENLLGFCSPQAFVIILGPSTPMNEVLFNHGIDMLCGAEVKDNESVIRVISQGGNFHQVHQAGVQLVTMEKSS
jgi:uncharacterized protein (DUF4213/DUF364 family)